jgi:hypothetical protein
MSSSTLEVAARMAFILAKRPPGGARPCCSASPPKRWICCSHWPRRSNSTSATNSSARSRPSLEAKRQAGEIGEGSVHRVGRAGSAALFRSARDRREQVPPPVRAAAIGQSTGGNHWGNVSPRRISFLWPPTPRKHRRVFRDGILPAPLSRDNVLYHDREPRELLREPCLEQGS